MIYYNMNVCLRAVVYGEYLILERKKENKKPQKKNVESLHAHVNKKQTKKYPNIKQ